MRHARQIAVNAAMVNVIFACLSYFLVYYRKPIVVETSGSIRH